jgi:hypothetical protein
VTVQKGYLLNELKVKISRTPDKLATEVQLEHAAFETQAIPTHAQTGTLTASPIMLCS